MIPTQTLTRFVHQEERKHPQTTGELSELLTSIGLGVKIISNLVATAGLKGLDGYSGRTNIQGEDTYKLDDQADSVLVDILGASGHFGSLVSEERDGAIETGDGNEEAKYAVAFDPLDGSSNIGSNIPVGTIFTIFRTKTPGKASADDFMQPGRHVVAAGYSVYGSMTSFVYSCGYGVHGFTLDPSIGEFVLTEENIRIPEKGNIYSANEGYWDLWDERMQHFMSSLRSKENGLGGAYTSRYVGSLVADFDRTLRKGGIFLHPSNTKRSRGKLRLLYECIPLAFIMEQAGGRAIDQKMDVLDINPEGIHDRCPFVVGGKAEIEYFESFFQ